MPTEERSPQQMRPCPLCGGMDRNLVLRWDEWELVKCKSCEMIFLGRELPYAEQAKKHDWFDEYTKEVTRRKRKYPLLRFISRSFRFLRPDTNSRMLSQTLRWRREGKLVDFGCGDGTFLALASKHFDVTGIELGPREAELARHEVVIGTARRLVKTKDKLKNEPDCGLTRSTYQGCNDSSAQAIGLGTRPTNLSLP